jgi:protein involved in polysaccharide export with SLBB domain
MPQRTATIKNSALIVLAFAVFSYNLYGQDTANNQSEMDLIHYGDVIDVDVVGSMDFDWRGTLNPEGFLSGFDKVEEPIFALCRSETDVAAAINSQYAKILRDPKVVVRIIDRTNRAVAIIDGAVKKPQRFQIKRSVNLSEIIVLAGGITDRSSGEINIFRPPSLNCLDKVAANNKSDTFVKASQGNGSQMMNIRISDLLSAKEGSNPQILSGDIITVTEAQPIYVLGGVSSPGRISSKTTLTLSRAIAMAGGLSKDATADKITVFRRSGGQTTTIEIDLKRITDKQAEDPELKPFDIIDVGQKGRGKRKFPPAIDPRMDSTRFAGLPLQVID